MQWAINAYLLALAALFAFGGRLADTVGHRQMVVLGVRFMLGQANTDAINRASQPSTPRQQHDRESERPDLEAGQ